MPPSNRKIFAITSLELFMYCKNLSIAAFTGIYGGSSTVAGHNNCIDNSPIVFLVRPMVANLYPRHRKGLAVDQ